MLRRHILIAHDIEDRTEAGKQRFLALRMAASAFAERMQVEIRLFAVEDMIKAAFGRIDAAAIRAWQNRHRKMLEEAASQFAGPIHCSLRRGSPVEEILNTLGARRSPELAILGTGGRRGLRRLFLGGVAEEVIRRSRKPVMVIGPECQKRAWFLAADRQHLRILVATDLGDDSSAAERYALSLAKRTPARVCLYHSTGESVRGLIGAGLFPGTALPDLDTLTARIGKDARKSLRKKAAHFRRHGIPCEYRLDESTAPSASLVPEEAGKGYSFVVMGTRGRNRMLSAYFGSTARETILHAQIPVIIVRARRP